MTDTLPPFPVDDMALSAVEHALDASVAYESEDGDRLDEPRVVGADYQLDTLFDFMSGHDSTKAEQVNDATNALGSGVESVWDHTESGPTYTRDDVIRALITEVRRMRSEGSTNALDLIVIDSAAAPFQCNAPDCTRVAGHMGPHRA